MDSRYLIAFSASNGLRVQVPLGTNSARLVGGFGGWEVVDRPKRVSLTRFKGKAPFRMDVPILFDGWQDHSSQEVQISTLARMAEQPGDQQPPPQVTVRGAVPRDDLVWVIDDLEWDDQSVDWEIQRGVPVRIRQAVVVHLLQFVDDDVIITKPTPAVKAGGNTSGGTTKTATDQTSLRQLAGDQYGDPSLWWLIGDANDINDPRTAILPGTPIYLPPQP